MIKSSPIRVAFTFLTAILSFFASTYLAHAQDGGNRMTQRLSGMDENHNGVLEPNEWQNSPMRGFVERVGGESHLDLSKPVSIEKMAEGMNEMRNRGGFGGGGFGGDRGGFGGGRGGFGGEGRGGWGGRGEGGRGGWGGPGGGPGGEGGWGGRGGGFGGEGRDGGRDRDGRDKDGRDRDGRDKGGRDGRNDNRDGKDKPESKDVKSDKDKLGPKSVNSIVLGFGDPSTNVSSPVLGFSDPNSAIPGIKGADGTPEAGTSPSNAGGAGGDERERRDRVREMARIKIAQYDENKDGVLQKNEWTKISGEPKKADANNDELITLDEYSNRLWEKTANGGQENWSGGGSNFNNGGFANRANLGTDPNKATRYLSATERLPEGMPSWFKPADMNGDGQVSMAEYSNNWSDSRLAEFRRIDKNNDGIITSQECVMTPLARSNYASADSSNGDFSDGYGPDGNGSDGYDGPVSSGGSDQARGPRREGGRGDFSRGDANKSFDPNAKPSFPAAGAPSTNGGPPAGFNGGGAPGGFGNRGGFDRGRGDGSKGGPGGWSGGFGGRRNRGGDGNRDGGSRSEGNR